MPKRGDVVLYTQGEKTYNALVMQANAVDASLLGENGEPTLHLAVIFDDPLVNGKPKAMPIGYIPQVSYVFDAVHASHEFSDEYKREHGLHDELPGVHAASLSSGILARRGAGEWSEAFDEESAREILRVQMRRINELERQIEDAHFRRKEDGTFTLVDPPANYVFGGGAVSPVSEPSTPSDSATAEARTVEGADLGRGTFLVSVDGGDMPLPMGRGAAALSDSDPKE